MIRRTSWWACAFASIYALTLGFNARQEFYGPANVGWTPQWPSLIVGDIAPHSAADLAGVRKGDLIESVNGLSITAMPDWFVARSHFESGIPVHLQVRRDDLTLDLQVVPAVIAQHPGHWLQRAPGIALYGARLLLFLFALWLGMRNCTRPARIAAALFAIAAVAEGYPSSGWAASLAHLPSFLAIPICLASVSCLLSPIGCYVFLLDLLGLSSRRKWIVRVMLTVAFGFSLLVLGCSVAMIYAPWLLSKPWPLILHAWPVRLIQDVSGVTPLLLLNVLQLKQPIVQRMVLELWLAVTIACFAGCFSLLFLFRPRFASSTLILQVNLLRSAFLLFGAIVVHNVLVRNWSVWFGSPAPFLFRAPTFVAEALLLVLVLLLVAYPLIFPSRQETPTHSGRVTH